MSEDQLKPDIELISNQIWNPAQTSLLFYLDKEDGGKDIFLSYANNTWFSAISCLSTISSKSWVNLKPGVEVYGSLEGLDEVFVYLGKARSTQADSIDIALVMPRALELIRLLLVTRGPLS